MWSICVMWASAFSKQMLLIQWTSSSWGKLRLIRLGQCSGLIWVLQVCTKKIIFLFLTKTNVVGTQKNRLDDTILLSNQNIYLNWWVRNYLQFYTHMFCLSKPMVLAWHICLLYFSSEMISHVSFPFLTVWWEECHSFS